jgi:uncharacterized protein (DUF488 family)
LTTAALGRPMSMTSLLNFVESIELSDPADTAVASNAIWVGSVGYENYRDVEVFAQMLANAGVERLVDVRELPISRRRGFAKTALSSALADAGVEYLHLRAMGNPKAFRDLYKSGNVEAGREAYERFLRSERQAELRLLDALLREKPSALMCVEHDEDICHRQVIFGALREEVGAELSVARIG